MEFNNRRNLVFGNFINSKVQCVSHENHFAFMRIQVIIHKIIFPKHTIYIIK